MRRNPQVASLRRPTPDRVKRHLLTTFLKKSYKDLFLFYSRFFFLLFIIAGRSEDSESRLGVFLFTLFEALPGLALVRLLFALFVELRRRTLRTFQDLDLLLGRSVLRANSIFAEDLRRRLRHLVRERPRRRRLLLLRPLRDLNLRRRLLRLLRRSVNSRRASANIEAKSRLV